MEAGVVIGVGCNGGGGGGGGRGNDSVLSMRLSMYWISSSPR